MKVSPSAHYTVRVLPQEWEETTETAHLYRGIFEVALNHHVDISFVPDISSIAPPWDRRLLPDDIDAIEAPELARLDTALLSSYVVTPNDRLAGTEERFSRPGPPPERMDRPGLVFYVTTEEFARFAVELEELAKIAGRVHSQVLVDDLRDREVIAFIERRIVASAMLKPADAEMLGQRR